MQGQTQRAERLSRALQAVMDAADGPAPNYSRIREIVSDAGIPPAMHSGDQQGSLLGNPTRMTEYLLGLWGHMIDSDPRVLTGIRTAYAWEVQRVTKSYVGQGVTLLPQYAVAESEGAYKGRLSAALQTVVNEIAAPAPNYSAIREAIRYAGVPPAIHVGDRGLSFLGYPIRMTEYLLGEWASTIDTHGGLLNGANTLAASNTVGALSSMTESYVRQGVTLLPRSSLAEGEAAYAGRLSAALRTVVDDMASTPHDYAAVRQAIRDAGVPPNIHGYKPRESFSSDPTKQTEYLPVGPPKSPPQVIRTGHTGVGG